MAEQNATQSSAPRRVRAAAQSEAAQVPAGAGVPDTERTQGMAARAAAILAGQPDPARRKREPQQDSQAQDDGQDDGQAQGQDDGQDDAGARAQGDSQDDGQAQDDGQDDGQAEGDSEGEGKPATVDDAAKRLGLTRQEFNALAVQVGSETLTLGELKARLPDVLKLDRERESLDDERGAWELERVGAYRNINAILDQLPRNALTSQVLHAIQSQHEESRNRELQNLHFARPRWADAAFATAARGKMAALAKEYGISKTEVESVLDHRQILLLQDYAELREKVKASRDQARKLSEPSAQRGAGQGAANRGDTFNRPRTGKATQDSMAQRAAQIIGKR